MVRIFKFLIRISSFLGKELIEILRQPRLIAILVLGPFLIMLLFGVAYPSGSRTLHTTFIVQDPVAFQKQMDAFTASAGSTIFDYVLATDKEKALAGLAQSQVDLVIVVPDLPSENIQNNQQAEFLVYHNEIDPYQVAFIQTAARTYVDQINRQVLQNAATQEQANSANLQTNLESALVKVRALRQAIPASEVQRAAQADELEQDLTAMDEKLSTFRSLTPEVLVSPFTSEIFGLFGEILSVTAFFVPAVIVLLLQHVSITFASLSIVREKRSGIMELFRVAPISAFETLVGKYISYMFFEIILGAVITALAVWLLKAPISGPLLHYALAVVVLIFTSLGVGFLISLISQTDTQAVQYSMLLLLASVFFSGFFMDLRLMRNPIDVLAWSLPATYGIRMLQDIMLRGTSVPMLVLLGLASIGVGLFVLNWILLRNKMQNQSS